MAMLGKRAEIKMSKPVFCYDRQMDSEKSLFKKTGRKICSEAFYKQSKIFAVDLTVNCFALLLCLSHVFLLCIIRH